MTDYLVDNAVWSRLATGDPGITARLRPIERAPGHIARVSDLRHEYIAPAG